MHAPGRKLSNAYEPEPFVPTSPYIASPPQHQQHRQHTRIPSISRATPTATAAPPASSYPHSQSSEPRIRPNASRPNNTVPIPIPSSQSNSNRFHPPHPPPPQQQHQLHHLQKQSISPSAQPSRESSVARIPVRPSNNGVINPHFHPDRPQPTPPVPEQLTHRHPLLSPGRQKPDSRTLALNLDKPVNETEIPNSVPRAPATTWQIQLPLPSPEEPESMKVSSEEEPDSPNNNGSMKRNPSRDSIEREQREQLEMADRLWMEEQAAFQREIEEQRRLYNASQKQDRAATPSETSPIIPAAPVSLVPISPALPYRSGSLPKSLSAGVARSRSGSLTHLVNPHNGVATPPHSFASVYGGSTKEERQKWRRDIRKVVEEQLRLQTNGHVEPADHHTTSSPAEDHSPRGRDALSHSDESRHPLRSRHDSKSHSFERSPSRDDDEEERRQEAERNRATAVSRQSRRSVISRGDYQRRRAHQDAKWRARRREKDGQRQALYRKRERERRIGDQSDAWSRSGVSALRSRSRSRKSRVFGGLTSTHDPALPDFTFGLDSPFTQVAKDEEIEEVDDDEDEEEDDDEEESSDEEEEEDDDESEEDEQERGQAVFVQAAWDRYQQRWNKFRRAPPAPNSLRFVDIPWPAAISFPVPTTSSPIKALPPSSLEIAGILNPQAIRDFLLSPYHSKDVPQKTRVETALGRYHPDQVMRWLNFVEESERIAVEVGAEMVFNSLQSLMAQLEHAGRPSQHATRAPHARRY